MNPAAPLYPPKVTSTPSPEPQGTAAPNSQAPTQTSPAQTTPQAAKPATPRPVMSAKAAINAMYAAEKTGPSAKLVPSAREAVNAASRLVPKNFKSASNLHHGSLQKVKKMPTPPRSMESTRTSASALIRTAGSRDKEVPVVHTSLKLGSSTKPKHEPVVLPAGARMAEAARPVVNLSDPDGMVMVGRNNSRGNATTARSSASLPQGGNPASLPQGSSSAPRGGAIARVITSGRPKLTAPGSVRRIRDPQMLGGGRRVLPAKPGVTISLPDSVSALASAKPGTSSPSTNPLAAHHSAQNPSSQTVVAQSRNPAHISQKPTSSVSNGLRNPQPTTSGAMRSMDMAPARKLVRPRRFRTAPKNYAEADAPAVAVDSSYAISEPPKLAVRRRSDTDPEDLGVVKTYHPTKLPEPIGDAAPIGRLAEQRVASGHGGPAHPETTIKAENTSNYSFSRRDTKVKPSYAPAEKSPFLKSVNVEKRPLSDSSVPTPISLPRTPEAKPEKSSRKNFYQKKSDAKADLPSRPTVIVPSCRRSKAPLFFLILFTVLLGAVVGAAVYLCFFQ